jgi:hypothetical protein
MATHPSGKLELLVSELMALDLAMKQEGHSATEWYRLVSRHRALRAAVLAMEEPVYPGSDPEA